MKRVTLFLLLCALIATPCLAEQSPSAAERFQSGLSTAWDALVQMGEEAVDSASDWINSELPAWANDAAKSIRGLLDDTGKWAQDAAAHLQSFVEENGPAVEAWLSQAGEDVKAAWDTLTSPEAHTEEEVEQALKTVVEGLEGEAVTFDRLAGLEWVFSSGAGGWSTELSIAADGSFTGNFHDSEMGEATEAYPDGTVYYSAFSGQMSMPDQADGYARRIRIDSLTLEDEPGRETLDGDIRLVSAEPYGISASDEMRLYLPGTPVDVLTEDMRMWAHLLGDDAPAELENWFLYSDRNESGFVGYAVEDGVQIANPWTSMTKEALEQASGLSFGVPEGAEDVTYRWLEGEGLAEMDFTLDGDEYCARVQPAALKDGELMNISGMYFTWENEMDVTIGHCRGTLGQAQTGSEEFVELCLWYDTAPGLMYSLSVHTTDLDGLDLTAVAEMVYVPVQGDA